MVERICQRAKSLKFRWKTVQVREDSESGESEDGVDDEMPCVIGESEEG